MNLYDLMQTQLDELGLSDLTLEALADAETICTRQHIEIAGAQPPACIAPSSTVEYTVDRLITISGRRHLYQLIGRSAYAELIAELDDHRVLARRWNLGVQRVAS